MPQVYDPKDDQAETDMLTSVWQKMHAEADTPEEPAPAAPQAPAAPAEGALADPLPTAREDGRDEKGRFASKTKEDSTPADATVAPANAAPTDPAQKPAAEPPAVEAPREIPLAVAQHWAAIPEAARAAIQADRQRLANSAAEAGRAAAPYRAIHERIAERFPETRQWTPEQLEARLLEVAVYERNLATNPAETLLRTARDLGVLPTLRQALGGAQASEAERVLPALVAEVKSLREQLAHLPEHTEQRAQRAAAEGQVTATIENFRASCGDEWDVLEPDLPAFILRAKSAMPGASPVDVLKQAYEAAAWAHPETRAKRIAAQQPPAPAAASAPARTEASRRALGAAIPGRGAAGATQPADLDAALLAKYNELTGR